MMLTNSSKAITGDERKSCQEINVIYAHEKNLEHRELTTKDNKKNKYGDTKETNSDIRSDRLDNRRTKQNEQKSAG